MVQVYFTCDIDPKVYKQLSDSALSISIMYEQKAVIALFHSPDDIPAYARRYVVAINNLDEDVWKYRYLDSFTGVAITQSVYVYPTTKGGVCDSSYPYTIAINPKDAFGDGTHPTTRMCIQALERMVKEKGEHIIKQYSLCDIGTGTGIIAIVAELFGFKNIDAFDIDPVAIERAKENARYNGCQKIHFFVSDIASITSSEYHVVVANLLSDIIEKNYKTIIEMVISGGLLILSGISNRWASDIKKLFQPYCALLHDDISGDWHCMVFTREQ